MGTVAGSASQECNNEPNRSTVNRIICYTFIEIARKLFEKRQDELSNEMIATLKIGDAVCIPEYDVTGKVVELHGTRVHVEHHIARDCTATEYRVPGFSCVPLLTWKEDNAKAHAKFHEGDPVSFLYNKKRIVGTIELLETVSSPETHVLVQASNGRSYQVPALDCLRS